MLRSTGERSTSGSPTGRAFRRRWPNSHLDAGMAMRDMPCRYPPRQGREPHAGDICLGTLLEFAFKRLQSTTERLHLFAVEGIPSTGHPTNVRCSGNRYGCAQQTLWDRPGGHDSSQGVARIARRVTSNEHMAPLCPSCSGRLHSCSAVASLRNPRPAFRPRKIQLQR